MGTRAFFPLPRRVVLGAAVAALLPFLARVGWTQPAGTLEIGPDNPADENARSSFEIHMSGVINPALESATEAEEEAETTGEMKAEAIKANGGKRIATVTLCMATLHERAQFEIAELAAPGYPQLSTGQILQKVGKWTCDFRLMGVAALLSKVAQSQPGTPLKIVGMYQQRDQRLQLVSVEIVGLEKQ